jgi:hypothetical protein
MIAHNKRGQIYFRSFNNISKVVTAAASMHNIHLSSIEMDETQVVVKSTSKTGHFEPLSTIQAKVGKSQSILPSNLSKNCICRSDFFQTSPEFFIMPKLNTTTIKRKKSVSSTEKNKFACLSRQGEQSTSNTDKQAVSSSSIQDVEIDDLDLSSKKEQNIILNGKYELGGSQEEVNHILCARPKWDEETVTELLRWGARPKLERVHNTYEGAKFTKVRCTFVQLSGELVENIWLPLSILKAEYPREVSHL